MQSIFHIEEGKNFNLWEHCGWTPQRTRNEFCNKDMSGIIMMMTDYYKKMDKKCVANISRQYNDSFVLIIVASSCKGCTLRRYYVPAYTSSLAGGSHKYCVCCVRDCTSMYKRTSVWMSNPLIWLDRRIHYNHCFKIVYCSLQAYLCYYINMYISLLKCI